MIGGLITVFLAFLGSIVVYTLSIPLPLKITAWNDNKCVASMVETTNGITAIKFAYSEIRENGYDQVIIRDAKTGDNYLTVRNWRKKRDEK